jgi:hypothetical protein
MHSFAEWTEPVLAFTSAVWMRACCRGPTPTLLPPPLWGRAGEGEPSKRSAYGSSCARSLNRFTLPRLP